MRPVLGPRQIQVLDLLREHGSLTPRQLGALLFPGSSGRDASGAGRASGGGKGVTTSAGHAARGAGGLLGRMARAGWVKAEQGRRYEIAYSSTAAGLEALLVTRATLEADPLVALGETVPEGRKRCGRCGRARPLERFERDNSSPDGLYRRCKPCHAEQQGELRAVRLEQRDAAQPWARASKEMLVSHLTRLIAAARRARRAGTWRGIEGIRAYSELGEILDALGNDADALLSQEEAVDAADTGRPLHCPPSDADYGPQHRTPAKYRGRLVDHRETGA